jgi:hypothetical protein
MISSLVTISWSTLSSSLRARIAAHRLVQLPFCAIFAVCSHAVCPNLQLSIRAAGKGKTKLLELKRADFLKLADICPVAFEFLKSKWNHPNDEWTIWVTPKRERLANKLSKLSTAAVVQERQEPPSPGPEA